MALRSASATSRRRRVEQGVVDPQLAVVDRADRHDAAHAAGEEHGVVGAQVGHAPVGLDHRDAAGLGDALDGGAHDARAGWRPRPGW